VILQLSSQKQIGSWSSKGKLSSPVVYDADGNQYIAVFSRNELRLWTEHEENLDKVKKMKVRNIQRYTVLGDLANVCSVLHCVKYYQCGEKGMPNICHLLTDISPVVHLWCRYVVGLPSSLQKGLRLRVRLVTISLCT
jgi:hypothetical protein